MVKQDKIFAVEDLSAKIKDAKAIALADFRGISVSQATALREKVRAVGGQLQVIKNTLLLRALRDNLYEVEPSSLQGQTMVLFANQDEVTPLKSVASYAKTLNGLLPWKVGFMNGKVLSAEEVTKIASLPAKNELQAKLVGLLFSQPSRLVYALSYNQQKLVLVLSAIKSKKQ